MLKKLSCVSLAIILASPLLAGTLKGVTMADTMDLGDIQLVLNGMALRKKIIFKVYVAGMYLTKKETNAEKILKEDLPRCTVMHFLRSVGASKINDGWYEGLKANTPDHSKELKADFDKLAAWMEKMTDGDQIIFTYIPDKGTEVKVKNVSKGTIKGKAFADAIFSCWIGPEPGPGETFKNDLLGK